MKLKRPRDHVSITKAADILGHSIKWVRKKIEAGELEAFKWSATDVTVSLQSLIELERRAQYTQPSHMGETES